ncbi:hypothetical protein DS2_08575 [Catenovulum agarivorans DS-2]|uniref:DUF6351 domain-containing protein n=1 Tax=Catenovulum agarivorans DS-2 TaxID=1328313 RepID=W7QYB3_9ALTE|nr:DUF6351 family protein [Catenovulum agarivorans]EWH10315.1 hypothetical protein DS2_08575 [Catenovulum agarivorans DS-2]
MKSVKRLTGMLLAITTIVGLTAAFISNEQTNPQMITALPPVETAPLLIPNKHIRHTPRPKDNFDYPIRLGKVGPLKPLYSGNLQYPFVCMTESSRLGQPLVDNQHGWGTPVYKENSDRNNKDNIIGYSKDCQIPTGLNYYVIDGEKVHNYNQQALKANQTLVRVEYGVIHRYIYLIAMPISLDEIGDRNKKSQWNNKLIYQFAGGAGIGFKQGSMRPSKLIKRRLNQLKQGYAVISSGANRTSHSYNMLMAEDTAWRVKRQFISLYGEPVYTVGVGGSGGGLAQYLMAQNSPGLIDGALPLYSYPDMVSQALYALDCDLLNNYYTFKTNEPKTWQNWQKRQLVEGLNANNGEPHKGAFFQPINQVLSGVMPSYPKGNSECINGWFGLYAYIHNPRQGWLNNAVSEELKQHVHWSHWQDLVHVYGKNKQGFARHIWGNEGVQYGLSALQQGELTIEQFIDLNRKIGSWKPAEQMKAERIADIPGIKLKIWLSLWGKHNVQPLDDNQVASRSKTDHIAVERGYRYGQIFAGLADIPILDVRHYLEDKFDMHHVSATFAARMRMLHTQGHYDNQVVWLADEKYNPVDNAFQAMDEWLINIRNGQSVLAAKPSQLVDQCFDESGKVIAAGANVFDGPWNGTENALGACSQAFKVYSTSRIQAGASWRGDSFDCEKIPVSKAIEQGWYGPHDMHKYQATLEQIFPTGVCDYSQADLAKPTDLALAWPNNK